MKNKDFDKNLLKAECLANSNNKKDIDKAVLMLLVLERLFFSYSNN